MNMNMQTFNGKSFRGYIRNCLGRVKIHIWYMNTTCKYAFSHTEMDII